MAAELIDKGKEGSETLSWLIDLGKIDPRVFMPLEDAQIIELTGWTLDEMDRQPAERMEQLKIVWAAMKAQPREMRKLG